MAATEVETPVKMCLIVLEKKVRNLEKRKGKLESYQEKLNKGEELNKDQLEAIEKYNEVIQTLEFSRDLQKQFQSISADADKIQRKQAKKEKAERQQAELLRLQELLHLQTLLDSLGDDAVRERLKSANSQLAITEDALHQLDEFYQLIAPSREEAEQDFTRHITDAAEHIQLYLDRSDRAVVGATYCSLHELIDRLESCNSLIRKTAETDDVKHQSEQLSTSPVTVSHNEHSDLSSLHSPVNVAAAHDSPVLSFLQASSGPATVDTPWPTAQSSTNIAAAGVHISSLPMGGGGGGNMFDSSLFGDIPRSSPLSSSHHVETSSYSQQRPFQDIVSSMQGSFHFLQESQIELDNQSLLPSVRTSNQTFPFSVSSSAMPAGSIGQFPARHSDSPNDALNHSTSAPHHFNPAGVSPIYHLPGAAGSFLNAQRRSSRKNALSIINPETGSLVLLPDTVLQGATSSDEACPVPIPLPNEVAHGQSLTFGGSELSHSPVNKQLPMNQGADAFRAVYEPSPGGAGNDPVSATVGSSQFQQIQSSETAAPSLAAVGDFSDSDGTFKTVVGYDATSNGPRGTGRQDNGYSRGGRGGGIPGYNSGRGGSNYNFQRGTGAKSGGRGGNAGSGGGGMGSSSVRGGSRGGRGFSQSGRVR